MSIPVLLLAGALAGAILGLAARPDRRDLDGVALAVSATFACFALAPSGLALFAIAPDWAIMYLASTERSSAWGWGIILTSALTVTPPVTCAVARRLHRIPNGPWLGTGAAVGLSLVTLLVVGTNWSRLTTVAYYETFHYGGPMLSLAQSAVFVPFVLSCSALAGVYVFSLLHLRRQL